MRQKLKMANVLEYLTSGKRILGRSEMLHLLATLLLTLRASCEGAQSNVSPVIKYNDVCTNECDDNSPSYWCGLKRKDENGKIHQCVQYTSKGVACITSCQDQKGENYKWCRTNAVNVKDWWNYCSLPGFTVKKEKCKDSCSKRDESYYWCKTASGWDYCSPEGRVKPLQLTRLGTRCKSECAKQGEDYYWCTRNREWCQSKSCDENWEYCSPDEKQTYKGKKCVGKCKLNKVTMGKDYYWCDTSGGSWEYCSPKARDDVQLSVKPQFTIYGRECRTLCSQYGKDYFWCKDIGGGNSYWDYCSPDKKTIYNVACNDSCRRRGKSYFWCHTNNLSGWDYCSPSDRSDISGSSRKDTQFGAVVSMLSCFNVVFVSGTLV